MKKYYMIFGAVAALSVLACGCNGANGSRDADSVEAAAVEDPDIPIDDYEAWEELMDENEITGDFRDSLSDLAFKSGSIVLSGKDGNAVFSPLSLYYALSILGSGASGETEEEIMEALGAEDRSELSDQCGKLYRSYVYAREHDRMLADEYGEEEPQNGLSLANSLWVSDSLNLRPEYMRLCAEDFYASSYQVDFKAQETGRKIGQWISEQTNSVLAPDLELSPDTVLAIINTLYYYGGWQFRFDESLTEEDVFFLEDGSELRTDFMNRTDTMASFIRGDGYILSGLPTNNSCEMLFLLPDKDTDIKELLSDSERLREAFSETEGRWETGEVVWKIPKFSFGSSYDLKSPLQEMGMESMFDSLIADFDNMSEDQLYVDRAIQEAHIGIDEEGVEGAAYTMIALAEGSAWAMEEPEVIEMVLDRPFLFAVHDNKFDVWLFLGVCMDPSAD